MPSLGDDARLLAQTLTAESGTAVSVDAGDTLRPWIVTWTGGPGVAEMQQMAAPLVTDFGLVSEHVGRWDRRDGALAPDPRDGYLG